MNNAILIVGAGTMQIPAIREVQELGYLCIGVDGNPNAPGAEVVDIFIPQDLKEPEAICVHLEKIGFANYLKAVFTAGTDFSYTVAFIAHYFSLPGIPPESALAASRKHLMRSAFASKGVPSPNYQVITSSLLDSSDREVILHKLTSELTRNPLVVKPVDNMGSRGVRKVTEPHELLPTIHSALSYSRSGECVVESFIQGPEFSIDGLFFQDQLISWGIARRHIEFPPDFIEVGHSFPAGLTDTEEQEIISVYTQGARALGITHGAVKGDIFLSPKGPMIGELAARLSGGYMSGWTLPLATGMNFTRAALQIALNQKPDPIPSPSKNWFVMERGLLSFPGTIRALEKLDGKEVHSTFRECFIRFSPGDKVRFPQNNVEKVGNYIYAGPILQEVEFQVFEAQESTIFHLDPQDPQTLETILNPQNSKVPSAYPQIPDTESEDQETNHRAWDGRTYDFARKYFTSVAKDLTQEDTQVALKVLIRFGLQAALICADILKGSVASQKQALHDTYREIYL